MIKTLSNQMYLKDIEVKIDEEDESLLLLHSLSESWEKSSSNIDNGGCYYTNG